MTKVLERNVAELLVDIIIRKLLLLKLDIKKSYVYTCMIKNQE